MTLFFIIVSVLFLMVCAASPLVTREPNRTLKRGDSSPAAIVTKDSIPEKKDDEVAGSEWVRLREGLEINRVALTENAARILNPEACEIIVGLHRELAPFRQNLLNARDLRQIEFDKGCVPDYLPDDILAAAREDWRIAGLPEDLLERRVEITGPANDPKMVINMLSRGADGERADTAMLDLEDSMKPSWTNVILAVENIRDAARGTLKFIQPARGSSPEKVYRLDPDDMPVLMVRIRGLHLIESNLRVDGEAVPASIVDLALCSYFSAHTLLKRGKTPKYYVPKVEHFMEARWWDRLFSLVEVALGLAEGTLRITLLIETLPAAFQMEEILFETRNHATGLNGGRWDKIFSDIKVLKEHGDRVMADRSSIGMKRPWMKNYALQLIEVCHRHGAYAMGGMAAFTPGKTDEERERQTAKVIADKEFESSIGHDGCWVSHPYFIGTAREAFTERNQLAVRPDIQNRPDLLPRDSGRRTMAGLRTNIRVGIAYLRGWNDDVGCIAWDNLMEDLATLEISRAQTWQWIRHGIVLESGEVVTTVLVSSLFSKELARIERELSRQMAGFPAGDLKTVLQSFQRACNDARKLFLEAEFRPFLTNRSDLAVS